MRREHRDSPAGREREPLPLLPQPFLPATCLEVIQPGSTSTKVALVSPRNVRVRAHRQKSLESRAKGIRPNDAAPVSRGMAVAASVA